MSISRRNFLKASVATAAAASVGISMPKKKLKLAVKMLING